MPVTSWTRLTNPAPSGGMTDQGIWEVNETWQAVFDGQVNNPLAFSGDPMLPSLGSEHPYNPLLRLHRVPSYRFAGDGNVLTAINFQLVWSTSRMAPKYERDKYEPEFYSASWAHRVITEPVETAYVSDDDGVTFSEDKTPIETVLGEKMIPGLEKNVYLPVCRYSRNELFVPIETLKFPGYVNNDNITIDGLPVEPGQALIASASVSAEKRFEEFIFRTVDFEIILKEDGWDDKILHRGFFCKAEYTRDLPGDDESYKPTWRGKKRCMIENGNAEDAIARPFVKSPEACILNIDGINLTQWTSPVDLEGSYLQAGGGLIRWYPNGGLAEQKETFVPHYRRFRHANFTPFAPWGFV